MSTPRSSRATLGRRAFLAGSLGVLSAGALAGCDTVTRSTDIRALNKKVELPDYVPWSGGPEPALPKPNALMPSAFRAIPSSLVPTRHEPRDGSRITGSVPTNSPIPPTMSSNPYWQGLNDRIGATLDLTITPGGDYGNKFATAVAGDTLGDIYNLVGSFPYLPEFLQARSQDLSEHLSGSGIRDYPYLANLPTASWRGCVYAGGIYAVPVPRGPLNTQVLHQRGDLFDQLGVDPSFGSVDELISMCRALSDPRRNRWALAQPPSVVLGGMMGLPNQWEEHGGRLTHMYELPEYQDLLEVQRRMLDEQLVHPDTISAYNGKVWFDQGSAVMLQDTYSAIPGLLQQNTAGAGFRIEEARAPGPDGRPRVWLGAVNNSVTAVAKASPERIRTLLGVLNWCASPFGTEAWMYRKFGIPGRDYEVVDGAPVLTKTGNSETGLGEFPLQYFTECPLPLYYAGFPEMTDTVHASLASWIEDPVEDPTYGLYSPTNSTKGPVIGTYISGAINDILLGRTEVSGWKDVVAQWRRRGGDAIRSEFERALEARGA